MTVSEGYDSLMVLAIREALSSVESGPFTIGDLDNTPDDGRRRELIDGSITVSPAPSGRHQLVLIRLAHRLLLRIPVGLDVIVAPYDWVVSPTTVLQPDLLVVRREALLQRLVEVPLLVAEVRSPSTHRMDATLKRRIYADAGVPVYLLVDPDEPAVEVLELDGGDYTSVATAGRDDVLELVRPFAVSFHPRELVGE